MKLLCPATVEDQIAFAREASEHFASHPDHWTYTRVEIEAGCLFAVRWGAHPKKAHAVLVFRLDQGDEPVIYGDMDYDRTRTGLAEVFARKANGANEASPGAGLA